MSARVFVAIVALVAILLGVAVFNIVRSGQAGVDDTVAESTATPSKGAEPKETETATDKATDEATEEAKDVDKTVSISVLNSTSQKGLASTVAKRLKDDGWKAPSTGNYRSSVTTTTVYYVSDDLRDTAQAIADALGSSEIQESRDFNAKITVVVASDYQDS
ncbi:LytR C-terminal domain-containing protein [Saxibacter everestensis]|uniref:LytR C-terminal domain-containing protein n=1 Tax=Saxibacter everestensis TaxID=2909229 RepID=A0ABY8QW44_9MICO|nr:LytR C-terminal domain-containing protein [Brevibacteriaceae bacterium ZFBP1038]